MEAGLEARARPAGRAWLAIGAVVLALLVAVAGAVLTTGVAGPTVGLERLAGGAQNALKVVGARLPFGYAFAAGMVAAVNPCGFSLLPAYLGLYLGEREHAASRALAVSGAVTASFVLLFGAAGLVLSAATSALSVWLPWGSLAVGV